MNFHEVSGIKEALWDTTPDNSLAVRGLIYKSDRSLSDDYYIKHVKAGTISAFETILSNTAPMVFVIGEVEKGTYLTTSNIPGVAQPTLNYKTAFAVTEGSRKIEAGKPFPKVGGVNVRFL